MAIAKVGDWIRPHCMPKGTRMQVEQSSRSSVSAKDWYFNHGSYDLLPAEDASSMSRDELAARFAIDMAVLGHFSPENAARQGAQYADALLLALTPAEVAPVAPPSPAPDAPAPCPPPVAGSEVEALRKYVTLALKPREEGWFCAFHGTNPFSAESPDCRCAETVKETRAVLSRPVRP